MINKQIIFSERPIGFPNKNTWRLEKNTIPALKDGEILIEQHYVSLDPTMHAWLQEGKLKNRETIFNGIENFATTYERLFKGNKKGKLLLKVIE